MCKLRHAGKVQCWAAGAVSADQRAATLGLALLRCLHMPALMPPTVICRKWATEQKKFYEGGDPASMVSDDLDPLAFTQVGVGMRCGLTSWRAVQLRGALCAGLSLQSLAAECTEQLWSRRCYLSMHSPHSAAPARGPRRPAVLVWACSCCSRRRLSGGRCWQMRRQWRVGSRGGWRPAFPTFRCSQWVQLLGSCVARQSLCRWHSSCANSGSRQDSCSCMEIPALRVPQPASCQPPACPTLALQDEASYQPGLLGAEMSPGPSTHGGGAARQLLHRTTSGGSAAPLDPGGEAQQVQPRQPPRSNTWAAQVRLSHSTGGCAAASAGSRWYCCSHHKHLSCAARQRPCGCRARRRRATAWPPRAAC